MFIVADPVLYNHRVLISFVTVQLRPFKVRHNILHCECIHLSLHVPGFLQKGIQQKRKVSACQIAEESSD